MKMFTHIPWTFTHLGLVLSANKSMINSEMTQYGNP